MSWVYSSSLLSYTVTTYTSQKTGWEAAKIGVYDEHSYIRSWRSDDQVTQQIIRVTFASPVTIAGVALFNLNAPSLQLNRSVNSGSSWVDLLTGGATGTNYTVTKHLNYYRFRAPVSGASAITDVRVIFNAQTPVDGAAYFELGCLALLGTVSTFPQPPLLGMREKMVRPYDQSGLRRRQAGPWRSEMEWDILARNPTEMATWQQIALQGEDTFFVVAKSHLQTDKVYLMSYDGALEFEDQKIYGHVNPRWVEMA